MSPELEKLNDAINQYLTSDSNYQELLTRAKMEYLYESDIRPECFWNEDKREFSEKENALKSAAGKEMFKMVLQRVSMDIHGYSKKPDMSRILNEAEIRSGLQYHVGNLGFPELDTENHSEIKSLKACVETKLERWHSMTGMDEDAVGAATRFLNRVEEQEILSSVYLDRPFDMEKWKTIYERSVPVKADEGSYETVRILKSNDNLFLIASGEKGKQADESIAMETFFKVQGKDYRVSYMEELFGREATAVWVKNNAARIEALQKQRDLKNIGYDELPVLYTNGKESGNGNFSIIKNGEDIDLIAWIDKPESIEIRIAFTNGQGYAHDTMTGEKLNVNDSLKKIEFAHKEHYPEFKKLNCFVSNKDQKISM